MPPRARQPEPARQDRRQGHPARQLDPVAEEALRAIAAQPLHHPRVKAGPVDQAREIGLGADRGLIQADRDVGQPAGDDRPGQPQGPPGVAEIDPGDRVGDGPFGQDEPGLVDRRPGPVEPVPGQADQGPGHERGHRQVEPARPGPGPRPEIEDQRRRQEGRAGDRPLLQ